MGWTDIIERFKYVVGLSEAQVAAEERRRMQRVSRQIGLIGVRDQPVQVVLTALDIGPRGLRVEGDRRLKNGERLYLYKTAPDGNRRNMVWKRVLDFGKDLTAPCATVVWVRASRERTSFQAGLTFDTRTKAQRESVARFLLEECKVSVGEGRENRKAPRLAAELPVVVGTASDGTFDGLVRDIAVGGALISVGAPLPRNTSVSASITLASKDAPLMCQGVVVRCLKREADTWELGVAFTSVASDHRDRLVALLSKNLRARNE